MYLWKIAVLELKESGFVLYREGANHEICKNLATGEIVPLKRHDFDENDLRYIRKEIKNKKNGQH